MSKSVSTGLVFAALFAIFKCILFLSGIHNEWYNLVPMVNIAMVLLACGVGIWLTRDKNGNLPVSILEKIRAGMRSGMVYAVLTFAFVFVYYKNIDKQFTLDRINTRIKLAAELNFTKIQEENPEKYAHKSRNDFLQDEKEQAQLWYSPIMNATLTLTGLMICSLLYSIILAFVLKYMQKRPRLKS